MTEKENKMDEDFANAIIDYLDYKFDKAIERNLKLIFNDGIKQGIEQTYLKMIFKGMDPRVLGCSEELFRELYEKAKQMNN